MKGNIQWVSMSMNYMKHTMSHEETLELIKIIVENKSIKNTFSSSTLTDSK